MKVSARIHLRLLGRFTLAAGGAEGQLIKLSTRKAGALLAYLAMSGEQAASREQLATLLWGSCPDQQARQSLRQALALLRKELGRPELFTADTEMVRLKRELWSVDAWEFERLTVSTNAADLEAAGRLFGGEFLSGLNIDEEGFDEWVRGQRQRLQMAASRLCETYAAWPERVANGQQAMAVAERLLALDPLREDWQRWALTLYARYRGKTEALAQAETFAGLLQRELGVSPEKETGALVERIRNGEIALVATTAKQIGTDAAALVDARSVEPIPPDRVGDAAPEQRSAQAEAAPPLPAPARLRRRYAIGSLAFASLVLVTGIFGLTFHHSVRAPPGNSVPTPSLSTVVPPVDHWQSPPLPTKPAADARAKNLVAIAVLPFTTLGDAAGTRQPVADAMTDDLINILSRAPGLRIISRQTMLSYRGKPIDVAAVGAELGVRYVLEGSVRADGGKLRVNVALIDPATRSPAWSARIERENSESSAVRDEIVGRLARELTLEIPAREVAHAPADPDLRDLNYKGWAAIYASGTAIGALRQAEAAFTQALARDPQSTAARIGLGTFHALAAVTWFDGDAPAHLTKAEEILLPVIRASPGGTGAYFSLGLVYEGRAELPEAIEAYQRALEYNPSHATAYANLGHVLLASGKAREGLDYIQYALRLSPRDAQRSHWLRFAAEAELELGHHEQAAALVRQSEALSPRQPQTLRSEAAILAAMEQVDEARRAIVEMRAINPTLTEERVLKRAVKLAAGQPEFLRGLRLALAPAADPWQSPTNGLQNAAIAARANERLIPVVVLPFASVVEGASSNPSLADQITDDLINTLSRVYRLRVISRNTSQQYKGKPADAAVLGAELGVRYVLEGSVRAYGDRLRVNAELIDTATRLAVWSDQIEYEQADYNVVTDEIVTRIGHALQVETQVIEVRRTGERPSAVYQLVDKGWVTMFAGPSTLDRLNEGKALFEQALRQDPNSLAAQTGLAAYHVEVVSEVLVSDPAPHTEEALKLLHAVIARDSNAATAYYFLARAQRNANDFNTALRSFARAIELNPSYTSAHAQVGLTLMFLHRPADALAHILYTIRLSPKDQGLPFWLRFAAEADLSLGHDEQAVQYLERSLEMAPKQLRTWGALAAVQALSGNTAAARKAIAKVRELGGGSSDDELLKSLGRLDRLGPNRLHDGLQMAFALGGEMDPWQPPRPPGQPSENSPSKQPSGFKHAGWPLPR